MRHNFKNLKMWQKARENNLMIYNLTTKFPKEELYGLTSQIRRSIVSVSSNLAEGSGYDSDSQFLRFIQMAIGSLCEAESQLYLAHDLGYISKNELDEIDIHFVEQKKIIQGFRKKLQTNTQL